jgi:hypothetical protein
LCPPITRSAVLPESASRLTRRVAFALIAVGYAALFAGWVVGNPLGRAPDEPAHYVRALAAGSGDVLGRRVPAAPTGLTDAEHAWINRTERLFVLPQRQALMPNLPCSPYDPEVPAACQQGWPPGAGREQPSYVGSYQPYAYLAPGLLMRLGDSPWSAWIFGRATFALLALGLIALGLLAVGARPITTAALLLAVTPMVVFLGSTLNPSGIESAAGVSFAAGLVGVLREGRTRWPAWGALAAGGVLLAATRSLGPYFIVVLVAAFALAFGSQRTWARLKQARMAALVVGALVAAAIVANVAWEQTQQPHLALSPSLIGHLSLTTVPRLVVELIARFGWTETPISAPLTLAWLLLAAGLVALALAASRWRQRAALIGLVAVVAGLIVLLRTVLPIDTGFAAQGRYVLPLAVAIPIMAGELVRRHELRLPSRIAPVFAGSAIAVAALVQGLAFYLNARRYAVGTSGPRWFVSHALWSPPGGWWIWLGLGIGGAALLAAGGLIPFARAERNDAAADRPSRAPAEGRRRADIL